ncbi:uncharacterized protein BKA55DRAFT_566407 [Fusarium redolens]|uniref:Transmembrane protein n=1 Tax=Fusarium redolens TaxID=48865 RepID=A0A9P9HAV8_FUSRE|nr:uncharacterized protein BKA55DRAFT_566407 [Fusarium redolens]KAH7253881.1 hypothetical protein BKA55DRAFT_566407 [Fusarium redolens]
MPSETTSTNSSSGIASNRSHKTPMMTTPSSTGVMKHEGTLLSLISGTGLFAGGVHFVDFVCASLVSLTEICTAARHWVLVAIVLVITWRWLNRILETGGECHTHR